MTDIGKGVVGIQECLTPGHLLPALASLSPWHGGGSCWVDPFPWPLFSLDYGNAIPLQ